MPCLEISMPVVSVETKQKLVTELTKVFAGNSGFPAEIFGIRFHEYAENTAASGGKLIDNSSKRPYIHFLLYCPRIKRTVKQKLVEEFSKAFTNVVGKDNWWPVIHICEHPYDNVGVEGQLLSDAYEQCRDSKFYYDLSD